MSRFVNQATWDRVLRTALGLGLLLAGWLGLAAGVWEVALKVFGWYPLITGVTGWSPIYVLLGISTRRIASQRRPLD